jgi:hypothetical protein
MALRNGYRSVCGVQLQEPGRTALPRFDWVWWRAAPELRTLQSRLREGVPERQLPWKALRGRLPVRLLVAFKISLLTEKGAQLPDLQLALVETTQVVNGGKPDCATSMVRVARPTGRVGYQILHLDSIDGAAHVIPLHPKPRENKAWIVNSHIDVETWNEVTNEDEEYRTDGMDSGEDDTGLDLEAEPPEISAWLGRDDTEH